MHALSRYLAFYPDPFSVSILSVIEAILLDNNFTKFPVKYRQFFGFDKNSITKMFRLFLSDCIFVDDNFYNGGIVVNIMGKIEEIFKERVKVDEWLQLNNNVEVKKKKKTQLHCIVILRNDFY